MIGTAAKRDLNDAVGVLTIRGIIGLAAVAWFVGLALLAR